MGQTLRDQWIAPTDGETRRVEPGRATQPWRSAVISNKTSGVLYVRYGTGIAPVPLTGGFDYKIPPGWAETVDMFQQSGLYYLWQGTPAGTRQNDVVDTTFAVDHAPPQSLPGILTTSTATDYQVFAFGTPAGNLVVNSPSSLPVGSFLIKNRTFRRISVTFTSSLGSENLTLDPTEWISCIAAGSATSITLSLTTALLQTEQIDVYINDIGGNYQFPVACGTLFNVFDGSPRSLLGGSATTANRTTVGTTTLVTIGPNTAFKIVSAQLHVQAVNGGAAVTLDSSAIDCSLGVFGTGGPTNLISGTTITEPAVAGVSFGKSASVIPMSEGITILGGPGPGSNTIRLNTTVVASASYLAECNVWGYTV